MGKAIKNIFKTETLCLTECTDGYFLYDYVIEMNISMRAKTEQDACIEALLYYQKTLQELKLNYKTLNNKVEKFVSEFLDEEND